MHTRAACKHKPPTSGDRAAGHIDAPSGAGSGFCRDPDFEALQSALARLGHRLVRDEALDGQAAYRVERWGLVRQLPTLEAVRQFLAQVGGRP